MKLLAVFQIILLLATCAVPEGRQLLVRGAECGCSDEARQTGSCCCCSDKCDSQTDDGDTQKPAPTKSCCRRTCGPAPSRHSRPAPSTACCSAHRPQTDDAPTGQQLSNCPCGGEVYELTVVMMPRVQPQQVQPTGCAAIPAACCLQNERGNMCRPIPESPPPQNRPC